MRTVVVTTSYPRSTDDPSGHFVRSSALALAAAGHEVHVIAPGGSPFDPPRERDGLVVHRAGGGALFAWPGAIALAREAPWRALAAGPFALGVAMRLREVGPVDRAVAHWIIPSAYPLLLATNAALEVFAHGADVRLLVRSPRPLRDTVLRSLLSRGAHFTFAAAASLSALVESVSPAVGRALAKSARVEPPSIDVPFVSEPAAKLRAGLGLGEGESLVVTMCRLIASKRVELAIEAAAHAAGSVRLVIVGDGPERAALEKLAADRAANATFTGALHRRDALAWLAAADVLVHPSGVEAAPTVIREARALGVPVVACNAGDVAAWARDDAGIHVVAPDGEALARGIAKARAAPR